MLVFLAYWFGRFTREMAMEFGVIALVVVLILVGLAFLRVFNKQKRDLKRLRKISGRGGDFAE